MVRDTTLAIGSGCPEADALGADNLSENRGGINLENEDNGQTGTNNRKCGNLTIPVEC